LEHLELENWQSPTSLKRKQEGKNGMQRFSTKKVYGLKLLIVLDKFNIIY
jgi:hypothetical protein